MRHVGGLAPPGRRARRLRALDADVLVVGAGAAGLATAIFTARRTPALRVVVLDGATRPGAKILVSGGGRCNVTNREVREADFNGGAPPLIRRVLRTFPVPETVAFFREIGVALHEEPGGKLFPDSHSAKTVLAALLAEAGRLGVSVRSSHRVESMAVGGDGFEVVTSRGPLRAPRVVLATGGRSLPKTGSDGHGYTLAAGLGHSCVPTTPALVPLVLRGDRHSRLSGVAQEAELAVHAEGDRIRRLRGSLLWTHFGVSGPVVLDASRHVLRARLEGRGVELRANLAGGADFAAVEAALLEDVAGRPRATASTALERWLPASVARELGGSPGESVPLSRLSREKRRELVRAVVESPLPVGDSRGYSFAEATAGGIPLTEIDASTMASRRCPGLVLVGEILDVDGRVGGFNFQWAWSSAWTAARGLAG